MTVEINENQILKNTTMKLFNQNRRFFLLTILIFTVFYASAQRIQSDSLAKKTVHQVAYKSMRFNEDWSVLKDSSIKKADFTDNLKYLKLSKNGNSYISVGGELRSLYEVYRNDNWGAAQKDANGYILNKIQVHTALHIGSRVRLFAQLKSATNIDNTAFIRPIDEDVIDLHQAFIDVKINKAFTFRFGRQELSFNSNLLIDKRDWTNVGISFDGFNILYDYGNWKLNALAVKRVEFRFGAFNNGTENSRSLYGIYATHSNTTSSSFIKNMELYYLGLQRRDVSYNTKDFVSLVKFGPYLENRHTIGLRIYNSKNNWDYETEGMYQFGKYSKQAISAWRIAATLGYTFKKNKTTIRPYLNIDIASGDRDTTDNTMGTFNPLFPGIFDPTAANLAGFKVGLDIVFNKKLTLSLYNWTAWRTSTQDGIYGFFGLPFRDGDKSNASHVVTSPLIIIHWQVNRHLSILPFHTTLFPGKFLKETPPGETMHYSGISINYKF
jgi:Alginate export